MKFSQPEKQRNIIEALRLSALAVAKMQHQDPISTAESIPEIWKAAEGALESEPEHIAWIFLANCVASAAISCLRQPRMRCDLSDTDMQDVAEKFVDRLPSTGVLHAHDIVNLSLAQAVEPCISAASDEFRNAAPDNLYGDDGLTGVFQDALRLAVSKVFAQDPESFNGVVAAVTSVTAEAERRELAWQRHGAWINSTFYQAPIFSPDNEIDVPLAEVYQELRCFWNKRHFKKAEGTDEDIDYRTATVADIHETMTEWLLSAPDNDAIRLVAGGSGSGKSSFAKAFAARLVHTGTHRVLFVELQHMRMGSAGDTLKASIGRHLEDLHGYKQPDKCEGFPSNPSDWHGTDHKPLLMIFDGLDELTANQDRASDLTQRFVSNLNHMLNSLSNAGQPAKAIVLGRDLAIDDALKEADRPLESVLHVAPIRPMTREDLRLDGNPPDERIGEDFDPVSDSHYLMEQDLRLDYWPRWCAANGQETEDPPKSITDESMADLNVEPLLLHLLIISDYCGARWREAAANRNLVYQDILSKVFARNKKKKLDAYKQLEEKNFFELMEVFALAAFRNNGRTGDNSAFEKLRKIYAKPKDNLVYAGMDGASLKSVALLIHSQSDIKGAGFEFVHKSFGEYLAARALIGAADRLRQRRESDEFDGTDGDHALRWCEWIGDGVLTNAVVRFLKDEARMRPPADATILALTEIFNHTLQHGFPVQDLKQYNNPTYRDLERQQRAAEKCFLTVLTILAQVREKRATISFSALASSNTMAMALIQRAFPFGEEATDLPVQMSLLDLSNQFLWSAVLNSANLFEANLSKVSLGKATLFNADLTGADLTGALLHWAILIDAHLSGARLTRAELIWADLSGANLSGANLSGARLNGADLTGADLTGANLTEADLSGANLSGANLSGAVSELTDARNLTQQQLHEAFGGRTGVGQTILPEGMDYPGHWHDAAEGHREGFDAYERAYRVWLSSIP